MTAPADSQRRSLPFVAVSHRPGELVDAVNMNEAAHILGIDRSTLAEWLVAGRLTSERLRGERLFSRAEVKALAVARYRVGRPSRDPDSYWVNTKQAAELLGVVRSRVQQLAAKDRLPYVLTPRGVRLFRREQLGVVANARLARRLNE